MVIGGLKHRTQRFNPQSVGVSATLMFISVTGKDSCMHFNQSQVVPHP